MKILVSFILSTILLNLSVHAGSSKKNSPKIEDDKERKKKKERRDYSPSFEKQKMEDNETLPGFENNPPALLSHQFT